MKQTEFGRLKRMAAKQGIHVWRSRSRQGKYGLSRWGLDRRYFSSLKELKQIILSYGKILDGD